MEVVQDAGRVGQGDLTGGERLQEGRPVQALHDQVRTAGLEDGRGREAVRDDVPQQVDLGGGVDAGAVAAQDVEVVEGEHVGRRAGGEDRAGFGGGGEGLVDGRERLVDGDDRPAVGLGGEVGRVRLSDLCGPSF